MSKQELTAQELAAQVRALHAQVQELTQRLDESVSGPLPGGGAAGKLLFDDVEGWVNGWFLPMFAWRTDGQRWYWCPQWWRHAEAIWRLELLWRSWESARLQPLGMSAWSTELDRHKWELLGDEGPFRQCRTADRDRPARHIELEAATADPAPPDWWGPPSTDPTS
jgi:hypothetical protein